MGDYCKVTLPLSIDNKIFPTNGVIILSWLLENNPHQNAIFKFAKILIIQNCSNWSQKAMVCDTMIQLIKS